MHVCGLIWYCLHWLPSLLHQMIAEPDNWVSSVKQSVGRDHAHFICFLFAWIFLYLVAGSRPSCWTNFPHPGLRSAGTLCLPLLTNYDQNKCARDTKKAQKTKQNVQNSEQANTQTIIYGNWGKRASNEKRSRENKYEKLFFYDPTVSRNQCYGINLWIQRYSNAERSPFSTSLRTSINGMQPRTFPRSNVTSSE